MTLTRSELRALFEDWLLAWNRHDLPGVMALMHEAVTFEAWTGTTVQGKSRLRRSWVPWFANHGNFEFITEDIFVDEDEQKILFRWLLDWPAERAGATGARERRRGVDVIHFSDGKILKKFTYTKSDVPRVAADLAGSGGGRDSPPDPIDSSARAAP